MGNAVADLQPVLGLHIGNDTPIDSNLVGTRLI